MARSTSSYLALRPMVLGLAKIFVLSLGQIPLIQAAPIHAAHLFFASDEPEGKDPEDPSLWIYLCVAAALVLLGGAFAGLTIALMGQVCACKGREAQKTSLHGGRTRYTLRSFETREKVPKKSMQPKCSICCARESIGSWSHCF